MQHVITQDVATCFIKRFCDNEFLCKKIEKNIIFRVRVYTFPFKVELGHEIIEVMKKCSDKNNIISLILW